MKAKEYEITAKFIYYDEKAFLEKLKQCKLHIGKEEEQCDVQSTAD